MTCLLGLYSLLSLTARGQQQVRLTNSRTTPLSFSNSNDAIRLRGAADYSTRSTDCKRLDSICHAASKLRRPNGSLRARRLTQTRDSLSDHETQLDNIA